MREDTGREGHTHSSPVLPVKVDIFPICMFLFGAYDLVRPFLSCAVNFTLKCIFIFQNLQFLKGAMFIHLDLPYHKGKHTTAGLNIAKT